MNRLLRIGYAATGHLARVAASVIPPGRGKVRNSFALRRGVEARFASWSRTHRDRALPLLWMHAPSVGEGLQARPVLEALRADRPGIQQAYTYYSPSARAFAASLSVDFRDILPFDTRAAARAVLDALAPDVLAFSKLDVWPVLVDEAQKRGVRLALISATLPARSSRLRGFAPALLRDAYAALDGVGAISMEDAERLTALGCRASAIEITGDTRYDQVLTRARATAGGHPVVSALKSDRPTLVAGSTWPSDEAVLFPAIERAHKGLPALRTIIAPHEPHPDAVSVIAAWASAAGLDARTIGHPSARNADVVIVDRLGVLGDLYALADIAYVGGGFHGAGLHSVLEPASFGAPVLFGPRHENSREAALLQREGGGASVGDVDSLVAALTRWLSDHTTRNDAGHRARSLVERGGGATMRTLALIERLLDARS